MSPLSRRGGSASGSDSGQGVLNYPNLLQESYMGCPNRIERYQNFESMDQDSEINAALDILSEFSTQSGENDQLCFDMQYKEPPTETESKIIKERLNTWYRLNELDKRAFRLFRNVLKYGDQVFLRDPETFKLFYVEMDNVIKVIVNESKGKKPEQYIFRNINPNFQNLTVTQVTSQNLYNVVPSGPGFSSGAGSNMQNTPYSSSSRFNHGQNEHAIEAQHVLHLSLTEGLDPNWPFGTSILEMVFKVFKQKELLEDSIVIYRVQRAPERRVFSIDVGEMPSHLAMAFIEKVKNEIHQRRIPSFGEGQHFQDSTYASLAPNADFFFPITSCISLLESIKLLDGRSITLQQIIKEFNEGKKNWTYSVDPITKLVEPGEITWAGITRKNAEVIKVTLDDDSSVTVTPDHRFILRNGSEIEAQYLKAEDSLMPLYLKNAKTSKYQGEEKYVRFVCPATGNYKWTHTMVCPKTQKNTVIHHIDCNSLNNYPNNLIEMDKDEHYELHRKLGSYHLIEAWKNPEKRKNLLNGIRLYHTNASVEDKQMMSRHLMNNSKFVAQIGSEQSRNRAAKFTDEHKSLFKEGAHRAAIKTGQARKVQYSEAMVHRIIELFMEGYNTLDKMMVILRNDLAFQNAYKLANPNIKRNANQSLLFLPHDTQIQKMIQVAGYDSWGQFVKIYKKNHKVKSIEWLSEKIDTGDLHISSKNNCHNFALDIGIFVHNSGRGSKVEQLPGGQNLDQINDLLYFNNKMVRALRIPSSYLPTGPEESPATMNDGRVGTALIQEYRFNQYCQRLQRLICAPLDLEFKAYLKWSGVNIDSSLFQLTFKPPQNFAHYRQAELDATKIGTFTQLEGFPYLSKRWLMERYLGLTQDEMVQNDKLWREENEEALATEGEPVSSRSLGITPGGIQSDLDGFNDAELPDGATEGPEGPEAPGAEGAGGPQGQGATQGGGPQPEI